MRQRPRGAMSPRERQTALLAERLSVPNARQRPGAKSTKEAASHFLWRKTVCILANFWHRNKLKTSSANAYAGALGCMLHRQCSDASRVLLATATEFLHLVPFARGRGPPGPANLAFLSHSGYGVPVDLRSQAICHE